MDILDFHSHILPHVDHGSRHTSTSIEQLTMMYNAGVRTVCATSHFYPQKILPETYLEARSQWMEHLLQKMGNRPRPAIIPSTEALICEGMEQMENLDKLCFEGTNVLLLEMPFDPEMWSRGLYDTIDGICELGISPILAHVDRYPAKLIEPLFEIGIQGQVNAEALNRFFKPRQLLRWIDEGHIVALGSDLHGASPNAYDAFKKVLSSMPERIERLMQTSNELLKNAVRY